MTLVIGLPLSEDRISICSNSYVEAQLPSLETPIAHDEKANCDGTESMRYADECEASVANKAIIDSSNSLCKATMLIQLRSSVEIRVSSPTTPTPHAGRVCLVDAEKIHLNKGYEVSLRNNATDRSVSEKHSAP